MHPPAHSGRAWYRIMRERAGAILGGAGVPPANRCSGGAGVPPVSGGAGVSPVSCRIENAATVRLSRPSTPGATAGVPPTAVLHGRCQIAQNTDRSKQQSVARWSTPHWRRVPRTPCPPVPGTDVCPLAGELPVPPTRWWRGQRSRQCPPYPFPPSPSRHARLRSAPLGVAPRTCPTGTPPRTQQQTRRSRQHRPSRRR